MIRLANNFFSTDKELQETTMYCITECIKAYAAEYFEDGYETEKEESLYKKVYIDDVMFDLVPFELAEEMDAMRIDARMFIAKKMAQLMNLLNSKEEATPDIFIEYLLAKMIAREADLEFDDMDIDLTPDTVLQKKGQLTKLLYNYFESDVEDVAEVVEEYVLRITKFSCFLGINEPDDESLIFWDWDYGFFDNWGFKQTISQLSHGVLATMGGYGEKYTRNIFTSIGEEFPFVFTT